MQQHEVAERLIFESDRIFSTSNTYNIDFDKSIATSVLRKNYVVMLYARCSQP